MPFIFPPLFFYPADHYPGEDVFLQYEKDDDERRRHDDRARQHCGIFADVALPRSHQLTERNGQREVFFAAGGDERPHVVVIVPHKSGDAEHYQHRADHRQGDLRIDSERRSAVNHGRALDVGTERIILLPQQKHVVYRHRKRKNERKQRIVNIERVHDDKIRNGKHRSRDHHCNEQNAEYLIPSGKFQPRKRVRRERIQKQVDKGVHDADYQRVFKYQAEFQFLYRLRIIRQNELDVARFVARNQRKLFGKYRRRILERRSDQPQIRKNKRYRDQT